jgi:hypothetical protein
VDIRDRKVYGLKRIPVGSYVEGLINTKNSNLRKVMTTLQAETTEKMIKERKLKPWGVNYK